MGSLILISDYNLILKEIYNLSKKHSVKWTTYYLFDHADIKPNRNL